MSRQVNQTLVRQFRMPGFPLVLVTTGLLQEGEDLPHLLLVGVSGSDFVGVSGSDFVFGFSSPSRSREGKGRPAHTRGHPLAGDAEGATHLLAPRKRGWPQRHGLVRGFAVPLGEEWFEMACCHTALAGAAGRERSGIPAGDGESEAGKATTLLRKAVAVGYRNTDAMTKESGTVQ